MGKLPHQDEGREPGHAQSGRGNGRGLVLGLLHPQRTDPGEQLRRGVHPVLGGRPGAAGHGHERGDLGPVPGAPELRDSTAAAELIMAAMATKEVMVYRTQARELGHGPRAPTPLKLVATAVLHGTATELVSRGITR